MADRSAVDPRQWALLRDTGTAHLLAISGLHIALIAGFAYGAARWAWSVTFPLVSRWPAQRAAAVPAIIAAFGYAALAGFSLPTQRAAIMVTVAMGYQMMGHRAVSVDSYFAALAVILLYDPHAVLSVGFWLSFGAVGILVFASGGRGRRRAWWSRLVGVHLLLGVGLSPLLGSFFQTVPLASPLANMVAVPWVSLVVVPLVLTGLGFSGLSIAGDDLVWQAAGFAWEMLSHYLTWLVGLAPVLVLPGPPGAATTLIAACGVVLILLPRGLPGRWLALLLILLPAVPGQRELRHGDYRLSVLDVGQGLAVVIQTAEHVLVYDTGPSYAGGYDTGMTVILPFLRARGVVRVDLMVLSHADNDHAGGAGAILDAVPVESVMSNPAHRYPRADRFCRRGLVWHWDGVLFEVLHPQPTSRGARNALSCVIKATGIGGSVLLPGDIESAAESELVAAFGADLRADVMVAPHHGSDTSSTPGFIRAVDPSLTLFSVGYRNRFGFPSDGVARRFRNQGARLLRTDTSGAIEIVFRDAPGPPSRFRVDNLRYWHFVRPARRD